MRILRHFIIKVSKLPVYIEIPLMKIFIFILSLAALLSGCATDRPLTWEDQRDMEIMRADERYRQVDQIRETWYQQTMKMPPEAYTN